MATSIAKAEEFARLLKDNAIVIVDYHAKGWCAPCKVMAPIFDTYARDEDYADITFADVDVDVADQAILAESDIKALPTFVLYKDGREIMRFTGAGENNLEALIHFAMQDSYDTR